MKRLYYDVLKLANGEWYGEVYNDQGVTVHMTENCATKTEARNAARQYIAAEAEAKQA